MSKLSDLRQNYSKAELLESTVDANPILQFDKWFQEALLAEVPEPNAMCLSTVSNNKPDARIVLLKSIENNGFVFFTNYKSRKGQELEKNNAAHLTFLWLAMERQVRIAGQISKIAESESDLYFQSRPFESRLGAIISAQSEVLNSKAELEEALKLAKEKYSPDTIQRPAHWGGYLLVPETIEFWQGRPNRLHDRLLYSKDGKGDWKISRLYP